MLPNSFLMSFRVTTLLSNFALAMCLSINYILRFSQELADIDDNSKNPEEVCLIMSRGSSLQCARYHNSSLGRRLHAC